MSDPTELAAMLRHIADRVEETPPERVTWEIRRSYPSHTIDDVLGDDVRAPLDENEYWDISVKIAHEEE